MIKGLNKRWSTLMPREENTGQIGKTPVPPGWKGTFKLQFKEHIPKDKT